MQKQSYTELRDVWNEIPAVAVHDEHAGATSGRFPLVVTRSLRFLEKALSGGELRL